jgi:hypothetical protein
LPMQCRPLRDVDDDRDGVRPAEVARTQ